MGELFVYYNGKYHNLRADWMFPMIALLKWSDLIVMIYQQAANLQRNDHFVRVALYKYQFLFWI